MKSFYNISEIVIASILGLVNTVYVCGLAIMILTGAMNFGRYNVFNEMFLGAIILTVIMIPIVNVISVVASKIRTKNSKVYAYRFPKWLIILVIADAVTFMFGSEEILPGIIIISAITLGFLIPAYRFRLKELKIELMHNIIDLQRKLEERKNKEQ